MDRSREAELRPRPRRLSVPASGSSGKPRCGWHRAPGASRRLSLAHGADYFDYSHGVRVLSETMLVEGSPRLVREVLAGAGLAPFLSAEGAFVGL